MSKLVNFFPNRGIGTNHSNLNEQLNCSANVREESGPKRRLTIEHSLWRLGTITHLAYMARHYAYYRSLDAHFPTARTGVPSATLLNPIIGFKADLARRLEVTPSNL